MMLDSSTAHTCHYRWSVRLVRTRSSSKIGFKTRYGLAANPFAAAGAVVAGDTVNADASLDANTNAWYRRVKVTNLM